MRPFYYDGWDAGVINPLTSAGARARDTVGEPYTVVLLLDGRLHVVMREARTWDGPADVGKYEYPHVAARTITTYSVSGARTDLVEPLGTAVPGRIQLRRSAHPGCPSPRSAIGTSSYGRVCNRGRRRGGRSGCARLSGDQRRRVVVRVGTGVGGRLGQCD